MSILINNTDLDNQYSPPLPQKRLPMFTLAPSDPDAASPNQKLIDKRFHSHHHIAQDHRNNTDDERNKDAQSAKSHPGWSNV